MTLANTKLIFLNTHPIQYFAPLYQALAKDGAFDLEIWYCSKHGLDGEVDKQFGRAVKWDIPILEGYAYTFLKNNSFKPSIYGFWGLLNLEVIFKLYQLPSKTVVCISSWNNITAIITLLFARLFGHIVCLRCEAPLHKELVLSPLKRWVKKLALGRLLFPLIDYFLYIGHQNKQFYQYYGIADNRLIKSSYAVDNERFGKEASRLLQSEETLLKRETLRIPEGNKIILFTGKLYDVKRPFDLLFAFQQLDDERLSLVLVGDGELRPALEQYCQEHQIANVVFAGFINQSEISVFYAMSDVIVLCSESETWGLSINEAMNFGLIAVVSDMVGCAGDLVQDGVNGFIFPKGDTNQLAAAIHKAVYNPANIEMRKKSVAMIQNYSYQSTIDTLKEHFVQ